MSDDDKGCFFGKQKPKDMSKETHSKILNFNPPLHLSLSLSLSEDFSEKILQQ